MLSLKITKERLKNHLYYGKWLYILVLAATLFVFNFTFGVTAPKVPNHLKVRILIAGSFLDDALVKALEEEMLQLLPEDQQEVEIVSLALGGGGEAETYQLMQVLMARMSAKEDDIVILPYDIYKPFAHQEAFVALEDKVSVPPQPEEVDLESYSLEPLDSDGNSVGEPALYGIPLDGSQGLWEWGIMPKGLVACVSIASENADNALICLQHILDHTEPPQ